MKRNINMKKHILIYSLTFLVIFFSCKKEEDIPALEVGSMDVSGAKLMLVVGTVGGSNNQFYKITNSDEVQKVKIYDQFGVEFPDGLNAGSVFNVNENFFMMTFTQSSAANFVMFNKSNNSMINLYDYGLGLPVFYYGMGDLNNNCFRNDSTHNVYFIAEKSGSKNIVKLNTSNVNSVSGSNMLNNGSNLLDFTIDGHGNIIYYTTDSIVIKKKKGGYQKAPSDFNFEQHWIDADGKINYKSSDTYQGNYDTTTNTYSFSVKTTSALLTSIRKYQAYFVKYNDKIIAFNFYQNDIIELDNASNNFVAITSIPINSYIAVGFSKTNSMIYLAAIDNSGKKNIFKIDPANSYSSSTLLNPDSYSAIYDLEVFEDGTVYFTGKRASDDKYVVAKISPAGVETILSDALPNTVLQIEKLSEFVYQNH